jgi:hypothetical protein
VTVGELARWAGKRHWGTRARTELVTWLGRRVILPYDERVAWKWGQVSILAEQRGCLLSASRPPGRWPALPENSAATGPGELLTSAGGLGRLDDDAGHDPPGR